jgi:hypothetical protein
MSDLYRVTIQSQKPEHFASLWGAADLWREVKGNAVVEQVSATGDVLRIVPVHELIRAVDRVRGQSSE